MHLLNITSHYSLIRKLKRKGIPRFQSLTAESSFYLEEEGVLKKEEEIKLVSLVHINVEQLIMLTPSEISHKYSIK